MTDRRAFGPGLAAATATATVATGPGPAYAADDAREANKRAVLGFYDTALNQLNVDEAASYFGARFVNHFWRMTPRI